MSDGTALTLLYDGTFEGLMTAVFEAYTRRPMPASIAEEAGYQALFGERAFYIAADMAKADRVTVGIRRSMGWEAYEKIWLAFLSEQPDRGRWIYDYIRLGFEQGRRIASLLTDDRVRIIDKWSHLVSLESSRLIQFVRFSRREGGLFYSRIQPAYDVTALLMPHFAERFNIQPFVIHDLNRGLFGVYDRQDWRIVRADSVTLPPMTADERECRRLWKTFFDAVAIRERANPRCQRHFMPKKYWKEITEMRMDILDEGAVPPAPSLAGERDSLLASSPRLPETGL